MLFMWITSAQTVFPYSDVNKWWPDITTYIREEWKKQAVESYQIISSTSAVPWKWAAFAYIQNILNRALWLIWFVALIILIYYFYSILFSKDDEWVKNAKKVVGNIAIAIAFIWLSWLIISLIFYVISKLQ